MNVLSKKSGQRVCCFCGDHNLYILSWILCKVSRSGTQFNLVYDAFHYSDAQKSCFYSESPAGNLIQKIVKYLPKTACTSPVRSIWLSLKYFLKGISVIFTFWNLIRSANIFCIQCQCIVIMSKIKFIFEIKSSS